MTSASRPSHDPRAPARISGTCPGGGDGDALAGEVGEVCNLIKKETRDFAPAAAEQRPYQEQVAEELLDSLFYLLRLAAQRGIDLEEAWVKKMRVLEVRGKGEVARASAIDPEARIAQMRVAEGTAWKPEALRLHEDQAEQWCRNRERDD